MARAHVLTTNGDQSTVVWHLTVPAGNNAAGIPWTTALKNSVKGGPVSTLPAGDGTGGSVSTTEATAIANGTVYEMQTTVNIPASARVSGAAANAYLGPLHDSLIASELGVGSPLNRRLDLYGYSMT